MRLVAAFSWGLGFRVYCAWITLRGVVCHSLAGSDEDKQGSIALAYPPVMGFIIRAFRKGGSGRSRYDLFFICVLGF